MQAPLARLGIEGCAHMFVRTLVCACTCARMFAHTASQPKVCAHKLLQNCCLFAFLGKNPETLVNFNETYLFLWQKSFSIQPATF